VFGMEDEDEEKQPIKLRRSKKHLLVSEDEDECAVRPNKTSQSLRTRSLVTVSNTDSRNAGRRTRRVFQAVGSSSESKSDESEDANAVQGEANKHFRSTEDSEDEPESMQLRISKKKRPRSSFSLKHKKKKKDETLSEFDSTDSDVQATGNDQYSIVIRANSKQTKSKSVAENGKVKRIQGTNKATAALSDSGSEYNQNSTHYTVKQCSHKKMLLSSSDEDGPNLDLDSQPSTKKRTSRDKSGRGKKTHKKATRVELADSDLSPEDGQIDTDDSMVAGDEEALLENDGKPKEAQNSNQLRTPINSKSCDNGKQTRSSTRLRLKQDRKGSMKLPERREILDKIPDVTPENDGRKRPKVEPRRLINNFFKEKSTYNCDRFDTYLSEDEEDEDDFIDYDSEYAERESAYSGDEEPAIRKSKKN